MIITRQIKTTDNAHEFLLIDSSPKEITEIDINLEKLIDKKIMVVTYKYIFININLFVYYCYVKV